MGYIIFPGVRWPGGRGGWKWSHDRPSRVHCAHREAFDIISGDERKEDCTLLGKVKLNAFRPSTSPNPWVIDKLRHNAQQNFSNCKQAVPRASVEDSDDTCQIRIAIGALSHYQLGWYTKYAHLMV